MTIDKLEKITSIKDGNLKINVRSVEKGEYKLISAKLLKYKKLQNFSLLNIDI